MKKLGCVLLVDDCEVDNLIHFHIISRAGIADKIQVSNSGLNAFNFIRKNYCENKSMPELILVDVNMPLMGGYEFRETMEKLFFSGYTKSSVIFLTNLDPSEISRQHTDMFCETRVIQKPLTEEKLNSILEADFLNVAS